MLIGETGFGIYDNAWYYLLNFSANLKTVLKNKVFSTTYRFLISDSLVGIYLKII